MTHLKGCCDHAYCFAVLFAVALVLSAIVNALHGFKTWSTGDAWQMATFYTMLPILVAIPPLVAYEWPTNPCARISCSSLKRAFLSAAKSWQCDEENSQVVAAVSNPAEHV